MAKGGVRAYLGTSAWILAILTIPTAFFVFYVYGQLNRVESRNLRNLEKASVAVERLVENAEGTVESLLRNPGFACRFVERQTRLELDSPSSCLDIFDGAGEGYTVKLEQTGGGLYLSLWPDSGGSEAVARFRIRLEKLLEEIPFGRDLDLLLVVNHAGEVLGQLAGTSIRASVGHRRDPIRVVNLLDLPQPGDATLEINDLLGVTSVETVTIAGGGYKLLCQPLVLHGLQSPIADKTPVATEPSKEGDAAEPAADSDGRWILCGLVEKSRGFRDAFAIAPHLIVALVSLVLLALFLWPVLKLLSMSTRERYRFADIYFLLIGSWGAVMLGALLAVSYDTYADLRQSSRDSLEGLADQIEANLTGEIGRMVSQLDSFDTALESAVSARLEPDSDLSSGKVLVPCRDDPGGSAQTTDTDLCLPADYHDVTNVLDTPLQNRSWANPTVYEDFSSAFWAHPCNGQQFAKLTMHRANTPAVSVRERGYFQAVQTGDLWPLRQVEDSQEDRGFFLQTLRSMTTGEYAAALSRTSVLSVRRDVTITGSSPDGKTIKQTALWPANAGVDWTTLESEFHACNPDLPVVAAISGKPVSTFHPVLAPGVRFAIMDAEGVAVFHSEERRAVLENLYEEIADSERLAAAVSVGTPQHFDTSYGATPHQVFIRPFSGMPWFIVTMADSQLLRTNHLEILMIAGFFVLLHLAVYFLLTIAYILARGRTTPRWLWPHMTVRPANHAWLIWMLTIIMLTTILAVLMLDPIGVLLASLFAPVAPIVTLTISPWIISKDDGDAWSRVLTLVGSTIALFAALAIHLGLFGPSRPGAGESIIVATVALLWAGGVVAIGYRRVAGRSLLEAVPIRRTKAKKDTAQASIVRQLHRSRVGHMAAAFVIWLIIAVIPAWGYASYGVSQQLNTLVMHENLYSLLSLRDRDDAISDEYRGIHSRSDFMGRRKAMDREDIYWSEMFWPEQKIGRTDASWVAGEGCPVAGTESRPAYVGGDRCDPLARSTDTWIDKWMDTWRSELPLYNETSLQMRYLMRQEIGVGRWWTVAPAVGGDASPSTKTIVYCPDVDGLDEPSFLQSTLPIPGARLGTWSIAGLLIGLFLLVLWVRYGTLRLFFGDITVGTQEPYFQDLFGPERKNVKPQAGLGVSRGLTKRADADWMQSELDGWPEMKELIGDVGEFEKSGTTRHEALERLADAADSHYEALWASCSVDECLVLFQLAREGVANPKQEAAVRSLLRRGLLVRDPVLRIMNGSFALYTLRACDHRKLASLEVSEEGFGWKQTKWLLLAAVAAIVAFLWITQPAALDNIIKYLTAAAVGAGALMKIADATSLLPNGESKQ